LEWFDAQITYMAVQHILENRLHMCMQGELPSKTAKVTKWFASLVGFHVVQPSEQVFE